MANETSIKQLLVGIVKECIDLPTIEEGEVVKKSPLTIVLVKNRRMQYSEDDLIIPKRMMDEVKKGSRVNLLMLNDGSICYVLDLA